MSKYLKDKEVFYTVEEHGFYDSPDHIFLTLCSIALTFIDDNGECRVFTAASPAHLWQGERAEALGIMVRNGLVPHRLYTAEVMAEVFKKQNIKLTKKEN